MSKHPQFVFVTSPAVLAEMALQVTETCEAASRHHIPPQVLSQIVEAATLDRLRSILQVTPSKGPGRPDETGDIAALVNRLQEDGLSWRQCFERCLLAFGEKRVGNVERVRAIWRRHFGKKKRK